MCSSKVQIFADNFPQNIFLQFWSQSAKLNSAIIIIIIVIIIVVVVSRSRSSNTNSSTSTSMLYFFVLLLQSSRCTIITIKNHGFVTRRVDSFYMYKNMYKIVI